jgi:hypothetical protein
MPARRPDESFQFTGNARQPCLGEDGLAKERQQSWLKLSRPETR